MMTHKAVQFCQRCKVELEDRDEGIFNLWECNWCATKFAIPKGKLPSKCPFKGCTSFDKYYYSVCVTWTKEVAI
jgi:hypothetical protein